MQQRATEVVLGLEPELCLLAAERQTVLTHWVTRDIRIKAIEHTFSAVWKGDLDLRHFGKVEKKILCEMQSMKKYGFQ